MKAPRPPRKGTEPPEPRRAFAPRSLSALLPGVTRPAFRKRSPVNVTLFIDWPSIIGPAYAGRTEPKKLSGGTLTVACRGPAAMELQHMQESVIERINTWCGQRIVERLKITQDLQPATRSAPRRPKMAVTPTELPDMPEGPLRTALEALGTRLRERGRR